jgi:ParG
MPASNWGARPIKKKPVTPEVAVDRFVSGKGPTVRINIEVPAELRARVKAGCAMEGKDIKDVITEFLEKRFPRS